MVFHPYQRSAGGTLGSNQGQLKSLQTTPKILHESNRNLFQSQGIKPETRSVLLQPNNALLKEPHIQADFLRRRTMATDPFSTMTELDGAQVMKQWTLNPCPPPPNHCVPAKAGVYLSKEGLESKETNRYLGKHLALKLPSFFLREKWNKQVELSCQQETARCKMTAVSRDIFASFIIFSQMNTNYDRNKGHSCEQFVQNVI